jgi:hypothetical protein
MAALLTCEGWPLVVRLFADAEWDAIQIIRTDPQGPPAQAAAVKLAHIEELRSMVRSVTPEHIGDPFDVAKRPDEARYGSGPEPDELELEPDDYEI